MGAGEGGQDQFTNLMVVARELGHAREMSNPCGTLWANRRWKGTIRTGKETDDMRSCVRHWREQAVQGRGHYVGSVCVFECAHWYDLIWYTARFTHHQLSKMVRPVEGSPCCVVLDAQIYVSPEQVLTGHFNYFTSTKISFSAVGHFSHSCTFLFGMLAVSHLAQITRPVLENPRPAGAAASADDASPTNDHNNLTEQYGWPLCERKATWILCLGDSMVEKRG
jgi:hypothetical protein